VRVTIRRCFRNSTSLVGGVIAGLAFATNVFLLLVDFFAPHQNLYVGLLTYLLLPVVTVSGLVLALTGALGQYSRLRRGLQIVELPRLSWHRRLGSADGRHGMPGVSSPGPATAAGRGVPGLPPGAGGAARRRGARGAGCIACHTPHTWSPDPRRPCLTCHADKRGRPLDNSVSPSPGGSGQGDAGCLAVLLWVGCPCRAGGQPRRRCTGGPVQAASTGPLHLWSPPCRGVPRVSMRALGAITPRCE
jgi:hypothetical protein